jgi:hypothetical protein
VGKPEGKRPLARPKTITRYEWAVVFDCTEVEGGCNFDQVLLLRAILLPYPVSAKLIISLSMQ